MRPRLVMQAHQLSKRLGHRLEGWMYDGRNEASARCMSCHLWANVSSDPHAEEQIWGSCVEVECCGPLMTAPSWARVWNEQKGAWI